tara:strand:+ start:5498 stop:7087 length:1590 start_codon:yes stop_codon:yes gene_type:complete
MVSLPTPAAATHALPEVFNFAEHLLAINAERADKVAFVDDAVSISYGELDRRVRQMAAGLTAVGVRREERILLLMEDCIAWPVCFLGSMFAGIVPVAVNTLLTADDYAYMLKHSRAQAVLVSSGLLPTLNAALDQPGHEVKKVIISAPQEPLQPSEIGLEAFLDEQPESLEPAATSAADPGFWLYSSGSTGRPKGTVHCHGNPYWTAELYGKGVLGITSQDACFSAAKLFFAYGLGNSLTFPLSTGATAVLMSGRPTPDAVFARLTGGAGGVKPSIFFGAPTGFAGMLAAGSLPSREETALRLACSAGEALPAELGEKFQNAFGVEVIDGIGSTEMLHIYLSNRVGNVRYGTTGWPVDGYTVELLDDEGAPVPDGEPGDLYVSGPSSALMYWTNREKTRDTFQGRWVKSGDKYIRNDDGSYTYAGRSDDMLKVSGIYVSPFEVESTVMQHPSVLEAAVVGATDENGLVKTKAYIVLKSGESLTDAEIKSFVKDRLAPYKYPRLVEFVDDLPKTATGKIQRFKLRELAAR